MFAACTDHGLQLELVIVDDNSPDGTGAVADELAREYRVRVIHRAGKLGLGTAVVAGFAVASADVVGVMDADFSHPPALVPRMLATFTATDADIVVASRYVPGGSTPNWPFRRRLLSRAACLLARPLTPIRDAASGFFLIRREIVRSVRIQAGGFKICLELLVRAWPQRLVELPYRFDDRELGESKMSLREAAGYLVQLRDLYWLAMEPVADGSLALPAAHGGGVECLADSRAGRQHVALSARSSEHRLGPASGMINSSSLSADRFAPARVSWLTSGLFFVTLATLMLEVLDTRLLSVLTWYHLSFLAVSVAMLGMAAGAVLVFVGGELFAPERAVRLLPVAGAAFALALPVSHVANLVIPFPAVRGGSPAELAALAVATLVLTIPFVLSGLVVTLALTRTRAPDWRAVRRRSARRGGRVPRDHLAARADRHHVDGARDRRRGRDRRRVLRPLRRHARLVGAGCWRSCSSARRRSTPRRIGRSASSIPRAAACGWTSAPSTTRRGTPTPT